MYSFFFVKHFFENFFYVDSYTCSLKHLAHYFFQQLCYLVDHKLTPSPDPVFDPASPCSNPHVDLAMLRILGTI